MVNNNSIAGILNTSVTDTIPAGLSFVAGSVTVNGVSVPTASPVTGIPVGLIPVGGNAVITFQLTINSVPVSLELTEPHPFLLLPRQPLYTAIQSSNCRRA